MLEQNIRSKEGEETRSPPYQRIRDDIITGLLRPDEKLKIRDLRIRYEAGSSPLREALSTLSADGLVTRTENRGFRVASADIAAYRELTEARCWIEGAALRESIGRGTSRWEHEVVIAGYELEKLLPSLSNDQFIPNIAFEAQHKRFHMTLIGACGNETVLRICSQLFDHTTRYRHLADVRTYVSRGFTRGVEHKDISSAALARHASDAVELLCAHYRRTLAIVSGDPDTEGPPVEETTS